MRRSLNKGAALARSRPPIRTFVSPPISGYGRTAAYRRIASDASPSNSAFTSYLQFSSPSAVTPLLRSSLSPSSVLSQTTAGYSRHFSSHSRLRQQAPKPKDEVKEDQPVPEPEATKSTSEAGPEGEAKPEGEQSSEGKAGEEDKGESKKKEEDTPPPPHGDKTPWQVFTETLNSEFKASKEWNESTKQIAAGYQDFTQNENLKKAQTAYQKSSEAVTGTAGAAIKKTAGAIGTSAAWTWDTSVVKGIRKGATVVGSGLEKATRPVRETEAFKSVKETIDDGSSSRYGGWSEKEERRRKRELREAKETAKTGVRRSEGPVIEDPEYVSLPTPASYQYLHIS
jgi:import inner membrane translocase subunit TIM44